MSTHTPLESCVDEAILFAEWPSLCRSNTALGRPAILQPVLTKPMLQRAVELLVRQGCRHIRVVHIEHGAAIEAFLHKGERWGCQITHHSLPANTGFGAFMHSLDLRNDVRYWLADATQIPAEAPPQMTELPRTISGRFLCRQNDPAQQWIGWGVYAGHWLLALDSALDRIDLEHHMAWSTQLLPLEVPEPLSAATPTELLATSQRLLHLNARHIVVGRGSQIHPSAKLNEPLWIGAQVHIGANAIIGPNAVIEDEVFIERDTRIESSLIMASTYVGEGLELVKAIACGSHMASIALDIATDIGDPKLLATLDSPAPSTTSLSRTIAKIRNALHGTMLILKHHLGRTP